MDPGSPFGRPGKVPHLPKKALFPGTAQRDPGSMSANVLGGLDPGSPFGRPGKVSHLPKNARFRGPAQRDPGSMKVGD